MTSASPLSPHGLLSQHHPDDRGERRVHVEAVRESPKAGRHHLDGVYSVREVDHLPGEIAGLSDRATVDEHLGARRCGVDDEEPEVDGVGPIGYRPGGAATEE